MKTPGWLNHVTHAECKRFRTEVGRRELQAFSRISGYETKTLGIRAHSEDANTFAAQGADYGQPRPKAGIGDHNVDGLFC